MSRPKQLFRIGARLFIVAAEERVGIGFQRTTLGRDRALAFMQVAVPGGRSKRFIAPALRALHVLGSSGFLSRGFEDQPRDFVGMGDQREMAGLHLDGLGAHPLGHEALKVRIDRAVIR